MLLDVREDDEWNRGHAAAAQHIPMGQVPARLDEIDRTSTLYVICKAGGRSAKVAEFLARDGFEPINVDGGMLAWAAPAARWSPTTVAGEHRKHRSAGLPDRSARIVLRRRCLMSGADDSSVLPVRHTLECPRQAAFVVSALQRNAVGADGN